MQIRKFRDNLSALERSSISMLLKDKSIIIKKADKSNNVVVLDKSVYLSEAYRQLDTYHYRNIDHFDFTSLRNNLNEYLINMFNRSVLDNETFEYLIHGNQINNGPGHMHLLPKIHKLSQSDIAYIRNYGFNIQNVIPPGRPIISQIGTITEYIGRYIDYFLVPIVQKHHTYIRDTSDFIDKLESIKPRADCLLCSFDISQMFTNCPIDEILSAVRIAYDGFDKTQYKIKCPPTDDLMHLLKTVLENNIFEFNGNLHQQCLGSAIGACCAPECCNILMYQIMRDILSKFENKHKIFYYVRYMDDGFMIYNGGQHELFDFFEMANSHHKSLKFTYEISNAETTFLDDCSFIQREKISQ